MQTIIGIDLGGTNVRAGTVNNTGLLKTASIKINPAGTVAGVLQDIYAVTDSLMNDTVTAIGIGAPGVVDIEKGIVYDVQNIPSWKEVPLKEILEERYRLPVAVNNDANCFVLGEVYFGKAAGYSSVIGLTVGTGLGGGIVIDKKLYAGPNCGAGEFGMADYLDKYYEYYACGQFFMNVYCISGEEVFNRANEGHAEAITMYEEMGTHLGNAIKMIVYTYDPELIIIGGSLKNAWPYYQQSMWKRVQTFAYPKSIERLHIELSNLEYSGILGAAALQFHLV